MKLQLTTIAAALSLTMAMSVSAAGPGPDYSTGFGGSSNAGKTTFDNQEAQRVGMNGFGHPVGRTSIIQQVNGSSGNTAIANQQNADQYSRIRQSNTTNSLADVRQGAGGNTNKNESMVFQSNGDNLTAKVRQVGSGGYNDSYIRQTGDDHTADVLQRDSEFSDSIIYQSGDGGHLATVKQINNADQTWSFISQRGDNAQHTADVLQNNADMSASYIFQADDGGKNVGHKATVRQVNEYDSVSMIRQNSVLGGAATATHTQSGGNNNTAISFQW